MSDFAGDLETPIEHVIACKCCNHPIAVQMLGTLAVRPTISEYDDNQHPCDNQRKSSDNFTAIAEKSTIKCVYVRAIGDSSVGIPYFDLSIDGLDLPLSLYNDDEAEQARASFIALLREAFEVFVENPHIFLEYEHDSKKDPLKIPFRTAKD